jgi:hypothetical protein
MKAPAIVERRWHSAKVQPLTLILLSLRAHDQAMRATVAMTKAHYLDYFTTILHLQVFLVFRCDAHTQLVSFIAI